MIGRILNQHHHTIHHIHAFRVVFPSQFLDITMSMLSTPPMVRSFVSSLHSCPKTFNAIGMDTPIDIFSLAMANPFMFSVSSMITSVFIRIHRRIRCLMLIDKFMEVFFVRMFHHFGNHLIRFSVQCTDYGELTSTTTP